jgi:hypothetical protein
MKQISVESKGIIVCKQYWKRNSNDMGEKDPKELQGKNQHD